MKSKLREIISKARYSDDIKLFTIVYRDGRKYPEVTLEEFINTKDSNDEPVEIPIHRIRKIKRDGITVWAKSGA